MAEWQCIWKGRRWRNSEGGTIDKHWTFIGGPKEVFYLCYRNKIDHAAGANFNLAPNLKQAKALFQVPEIVHQQVAE